MFEHHVRTGTIVELHKYSDRSRRHNCILELALDKCEETFMRSDWNGFGYWFGIYRREKAGKSIGTRNTSVNGVSMEIVAQQPYSLEVP